MMNIQSVMEKAKSELPGYKLMDILKRDFHNSKGGFFV